MDPHESDEGDFFWVGLHDKAGLVVFDKLCQQGESRVWVRLFVAEGAYFGEFVKENARKELESSAPFQEYKSLNPGKVETLVIQWRKIRSRIKKLQGRTARCHGCGRELMSLAYPICLECFWMKCNCGNCGCSLEPKDHGRLT